MRITLLFIFTILLSACGAKELGIKNADNVISYQITKRVPLYSDQKDALKKDINILLNKTKPKAQEMLPVLDEINLTGANIDTHYKKLESFYLNVSGEFADLLARYLAKLDPKQQKTLFETMDQENGEMKRRKADKNLEKIEDRTETILGTITNKQKILLGNYADYFEARLKNRYENRLTLMQTLKDIYKNDTSAESKRITILDALKKFQADSLAGNKNVEILKKLEPTLNDSQRERLRRHIQEMKELVKYYLQTDY
jgi:archaellum component FlaC